MALMFETNPNPAQISKPTRATELAEYMQENTDSKPAV